VSRQFAAPANRRFKFKKRSQLIIGARDETLSIVPVGVSNSDRSPVGINGCDTAPTPTGFTEIVSDDLPVRHAGRELHLLSVRGEHTSAVCNSD
jgi:hypothetical protein